MIERPYPYDLECVWLAQDRDGHLGAFVTGGRGPIPIQFLDSRRIPVQDIEELILDLPCISTAHLLVPYKRPDDYVAIAERGIFTYDWSDVHRTKLESGHAYELIAMPNRPIQVDALPGALVAISDIVVDAAFANEKLLNIRKYVSCREGEWPDPGNRHRR